MNRPDLCELNKRLVALDLVPELRALILEAAVDVLGPSSNTHTGQLRHAELLRLVDELTSQEELF